MKSNWFSSNISLLVLIPIILQIIGRILPDSDLSWIWYTFLYIPFVIIAVIAIILSLIYYKKQSLISRIFIFIGIIYLLYCLSPFVTGFNLTTGVKL